jgi:hypothetical protein
MKGSVWHGCQLKIVCFHSLNSQNKTKCSEGASVIFVNLLFWRFQKQLWRDRFVRDLGFYTVRAFLLLSKTPFSKPIYTHIFYPIGTSRKILVRNKQAHVCYNRPQELQIALSKQ